MKKCDLIRTHNQSVWRSWLFSRILPLKTTWDLIHGYILTLHVRIEEHEASVYKKSLRRAQYNTQEMRGKIIYFLSRTRQMISANLYAGVWDSAQHICVWNNLR
jgi:hypothetical protein